MVIDFASLASCTGEKGARCFELGRWQQLHQGSRAACVLVGNGFALNPEIVQDERWSVLKQLYYYFEKHELFSDMEVSATNQAFCT